MEFCKLNQRQASATTRVRELPSRESTKRRPKCGPDGAGDSPTAIAASAPPEQQKNHQLKETTKATSDPGGIGSPSQIHADDDTPSHEQLPPGISESGRNGITIARTDVDVQNFAAATVALSDGRIACTNCNRWFSSDRVDVHQDICARVNTAAGARGDEKSSRGREHTTAKKVRSAFSPTRYCRRQSSCPVFRGSNASARARRARGCSLGREKRSVSKGNAVDAVVVMQVKFMHRSEPHQNGFALVKQSQSG